MAGWCYSGKCEMNPEAKIQQMSDADADSYRVLSAEVIGENDDLLTEILIRVPAKPLIRFKCVSKRWLSLISHPAFCRRHAVRHPSSKVSGIFLRRTPGDSQSDFRFVSLTSNYPVSPLTSLHFSPDPNGVRILQSCNGLLLCSSLGKFGTPRRYSVYNPTTKQFSVLPQSYPLAQQSIAIFGVNLAFDPTRSPHYTVICVSATVESCYFYQIMIYSSESETGNWRLSGSPFNAPYDMAFGDGVYWNGAIHWTSPKGSSLYFDITQECLGRMPNLPHLGGSYYLVAACGRLNLIQICGPRSSQIQVSQMERDYSKWSLKYQVDLAELKPAFPDMIRFPDGHLPCCLRSSSSHNFIVLSLIPDENEEHPSLLLHIPGKLIIYRFKDETFMTICDLMLSPTNHSLQFGWRDAYQFIETLACV
ncbi:F-box protein At5g07610-like [Prosopis cineraria]|uniref:F-box protein At5g07610-like n=1 Tax=Prosopis cineraria TaxID=364024 RepID=UPI00241067A8|nr:F-box protein At5g07610-like [Prosopis cineraria]